MSMEVFIVSAERFAVFARHGNTYNKACNICTQVRTSESCCMLCTFNHNNKATFEKLLMEITRIATHNHIKSKTGLCTVFNVFH